MRRGVELVHLPDDGVHLLRPIVVGAVVGHHFGAAQVVNGAPQIGRLCERLFVLPCIA